MKKTYNILFFLLFISTSMSAEIIEISNFNELANFAKQDTLLVLDIDDTLLIPTQTLGTDVWFLYQISKYEARGLPRTDAFERALADWEGIRHITKVQLVEPNIDKIVAQLQQLNIPIIGLTTQGLSLATRTVMQLKSLNIDLLKTSPYREDCFFMNERGILFRHGILFTSGTPKGKGLLKLFDLIAFHPKKVVFINDKKSHLRDVEEQLMANGIEFVGLRYSYCDERISKFNKDIAEIQWKQSSFEHILSDEEARLLLQTGK